MSLESVVKSMFYDEPFLERDKVPVSLAWDESEHPRDDIGQFADKEWPSYSKRYDIEFGEAGRPALQRAAEKLGFESFDHLAEAAGATKGSTVVFDQPDGEYLHVSVIGPDGLYGTTRNFHEQNDGTRVCFNEVFNVSRDERGSGLGTEVLETQVKALVKAKFARMETRAAGLGKDAGKPTAMNGYYTWPRLGYDGDVPGEPNVTRYALEHGLTKVSDFMKDAEHRAWWKENGVGFDAEFDLKEGSTSRRVLDAYAKAKFKPVAAAWDESEHPRDDVGQFTDKYAEPFSGIAYHGRGGDVKTDSELPMFLAEKRSAASWYAIDRDGGPDPTIGHIQIDVKKPATQEQLSALARQLGVTDDEILDAGGDPESPFDAVYVSRVRQALRTKGYDAVRGSDILISGEVDIIVAIKPSVLKVIKQEKIKDYVQD